MATYDEVMTEIAASTQDDWVMDPRDEHWTYKGDLNIRLEDTTIDVRGGGREFHEPWAEQFGSRPSRLRPFTIYYGSSFVHHVDLVAVDGNRAYIPIPEGVADLAVTHWDYRFAQIVQPRLYNDLDGYLARAGIQVVSR